MKHPPDLVQHLPASNIAIIGDVIVDRTIFAVPLSRQHTEAPHRVLQAASRVKTVGGAGNIARFLAAFNPGQTHLIGVAAAPDESNMDITALFNLCRGFDDAPAIPDLSRLMPLLETRAYSISRLIVQPPGARGYVGEDMVARWDDVSDLAPDSERDRRILASVKQCHAQSPLGAVIVADVDKGTVSDTVARSVTEWARENAVPLFASPKRRGSKFSPHHGTCILPDLAEWAAAVGQFNELERLWRQLDDEHTLQDIAQRTYRHFPHFKFHVITCGGYGGILIVPEGPDALTVYRWPSLVSPDAAPRVKKLGCNDVFCAMLAMKYLASPGVPNAPVEAVRFAAAAASAHFVSEWHRMPPEHTVNEFLKTSQTRRPVRRTRWTGMLVEQLEQYVFTQQAGRIDLGIAGTQVSGLYSVDAQYRATLEAILHNLASQAIQPEPKAQLVGGGPGSGKTMVLRHILASFPGRAREFVDFQSTLSAKKLKRALEGHKGAILLVDEAGKKATLENIRRQFALIDDAGTRLSVLWCFFSSEFVDLQREEWKELYRRTDRHYLTGLGLRSTDAPYILAANAVAAWPHGQAYITWKVFKQACEELFVGAHPLGTLATRLKDALTARAPTEQHVLILSPVKDVM